jgi:DNA-binding transcriptional LysR family regulator
MASSATEMAIFQRVAERGSFAGAAHDVGLSPSAVAKLINRLEARLGVRLINRTTRRLALTAEGEIYLERARDILAAIESAESEIASARFSPRGHLRVHTFPFLAVRHLVPVLPDFLSRYPQITFDFMVTNRVVDIIGENLDISLRMGALNDSALVARKIIDLPRIVCASPDYLERHGRPEQPADLARHSCLTLSRNPESTTWPFRIGKDLVQVDVKGPISADSTAMLLNLAIEGAGILRLSEHVVGEAIQKGQLEPLLLGIEDPERYPLWAVLPPGRQQAPKVRVFLDFLLERIGATPWRGSSETGNARKSKRRTNQN